MVLMLWTKVAQALEGLTERPIDLKQNYGKENIFNMKVLILDSEGGFLKPLKPLMLDRISNMLYYQLLEYWKVRL